MGLSLNIGTSFLPFIDVTSALFYIHEFCIADVSARSFYEPICVTDYVAKHFNLRNFSKPISDQDCRKVIEIVINICTCDV